MRGESKVGPVLKMNLPDWVDWQPVRWCRNSAVLTLMILGTSAIGAGLDSETGKAALAAAIAALAVANLDFTGDQLDKTLCKLTPIVLASIGAYLVLSIEAGEQRRLLISLLLHALAYFGIVFCSQFVLWNSWGLLKRPV